MPNVKRWLLTDLAVSLNATLNECLLNLSLVSKATGWHSRGHRLLRVALSELSGWSPKWSFATDTHRILNIRRRISPRWRFWWMAWPNLIKDFLDVQILQMHVSGSEENFKWFIALVLRILMKNIGNLFVRLFVISLLTFRYFSMAPAPAPRKPFRRLRLRLRPKCVGSGGSGSGSASLEYTQNCGFYSRFFG